MAVKIYNNRGKVVVESTTFFGSMNVVDFDYEIVSGQLTYYKKDVTIDTVARTDVQDKTGGTFESDLLLSEYLSFFLSYSELESLTYDLTTTDATTTNTKLYTPTDDGVYIVESYSTAFRSSTEDSMGVKGFAVFKVIAGVVTQVSTTDTVRKSNFPASVKATIDTDDTNIRIRLTGLAGATINWRTNIKIYK